MSKSDETLRHLNEFRALIEETIHVEVLFRQHLKKKKPENLDELISHSVSYQRFLEHMITDVLDDITL